MTAGTTASGDSKIVIIEGQEFPVPAATKLEAIRESLTQMFPFVANATVQHGKRTVNGQEIPTVEFVKNVGKKGATGADIAAEVADVRPVRLTPPPADLVDLVDDLREGRLTIDRALDQNALWRLSDLATRRTQHGAAICSQLDSITPVAEDSPLAW